MNPIVVVDYDPGWIDIFERLRSEIWPVVHGELKKRLAARYADNIDGYTAGKTDVILGILRSAGFRSEELEAIGRINRLLTRGSVRA